MAGWCGLIVIVGATAITCYTAKALVWCFNTLNKRAGAEKVIETYDELVEACFGRAGAIGMKAMTVLELYGGVVCMVVLHVANWPTLLSLPNSLNLPSLEGVAIDTRAVVACIMCTCALPTMLIQSRYLSVFAALGLGATTLLFTAACVVPLLWAPLEAGAPCPELDASIRPGDAMGHSLLHADGLGVSTGLALFAFAGHATFPELHSRMPAHERHRFDAACDLGFSIAAAFYCALGAIGYYAFGDCTADALTLNLMGASAALGGVATLGVLLSTFTSISVLSVPVVRILHESVRALRAAARQLPCARAACGTAHKQDVEALARANVELAWAGQAMSDALAEAGQPVSNAAVVNGTPITVPIEATKEGCGGAPMPPLPASKAPKAASSGDVHQPRRDGIFEPLEAMDVLLKASMLLLAAYLAVSVPNFGFVVSLMGAFTCMLMSFILPAACNLVVHWRVYESHVLVLNGGVVCCGIAGMLIGVQSTLARGA